VATAARSAVRNYFRNAEGGREVVVQIAKEPLARRARAITATSLCRAASFLHADDRPHRRLAQNRQRGKSFASPPFGRAKPRGRIPRRLHRSNRSRRRPDDEIRTDIEFLAPMDDIKHQER